MDSNQTITCNYRGGSGRVAPIILLCIGIPHLAMGTLFLLIGDTELAFRVCGAVFTLSGSILIITSACLLIRAHNRSVTADSQGVTFTGSLGRTTFVPWGSVRVTDLGEAGGLTFHLPGRDATFGRSARAITDMRSLLIERGRLFDTSGRPVEPDDDLLGEQSVTTLF